MNDQFRKNAEDIESEAAFSSATVSVIAESQLIDHPDGTAELVTDRLGFSLLVGQFEAMEARGDLDTVKQNESYGPNRKSIIFSEKDAPLIRSTYEQSKAHTRAYKDLVEQRGGHVTPSMPGKHPGRGV